MILSKYMQLAEKEKDRRRDYCRAYYRRHRRSLLKRIKEKRLEHPEWHRARHRVSMRKWGRKHQLRRLMYSQIVYLAFGKRK